VTVSVASALSAIPVGLSTDLLDAFNEIVNNYREHRWEPSELNGGKMCEAAYSIIVGYLDGGNYPARASKQGNFPNACLALEKNYPASANRSPRILIPRMMIGLYDIRNNRGVGHAGGEVSPNLMDATAVLYTSKWLMCELVRLLHSCSVKDAEEVVDALIQREVSLVWSSGDVKRTLDPSMTWKEQTLLLLLSTPGPTKESDLFNWLEHGSLNNYRRWVLKPMHDARLIDWNRGPGDVRLLPPGVTAAENLVSR